MIYCASPRVFLNKPSAKCNNTKLPLDIQRKMRYNSAYIVINVFVNERRTMRTESMSDINRTPKRLTMSPDIVVVTHYNTPAGVWIPFRLLGHMDALVKSLKAIAESATTLARE